jgi:hypothetical protein
MTSGPPELTAAPLQSPGAPAGFGISGSAVSGMPDPVLDHFIQSSRLRRRGAIR